MTDPPSPKLLADSMLGRLAKWLRILGYDTVYDPWLDDNELVRRSRAEDRVLLTRDHELADRPGVRSLLVESEQLSAQLVQVRSQLKPSEGEPFSRCPVCNAALMDVSRQDVRGHVPPYVWRRHRRFRRCASCGRIYWPGSHWRRMRERLIRLGELEGSGAELLPPDRSCPDADQGSDEGESTGIH